MHRQRLQRSTLCTGQVARGGILARHSLSSCPPEIVSRRNETGLRTPTYPTHDRIDTHNVLVWVHVHFEPILLDLPEDTNRVVHEFVVVLAAWEALDRRIHGYGRITHGPACSSDSQVTTYRSMLNPHPFKRVRCTSADPSSRFNGRPMNDSSPLSPASQKPSNVCEGAPTGALSAPERLIPRRRTVRPALSTN